MSDARTHFSAGDSPAGNEAEGRDALDAHPDRGAEGASADSANERPGGQRPIDQRPTDQHPTDQLPLDELSADVLAADGLEADQLEVDELAGDGPAGEEAELIDTQLLDQQLLADPLADDQVVEAEPVEPAPPTLEAQRDEYLNALRHLQADFENYKKRVAKQQADLFERANEGLVLKLLPVLDTADLAQAHGGGEAVSQLRASLLDVLGKAGLERLAPEGGPFDPHLHDAVAHEPGDGGVQEVAEVLRAGYRWNGRVLRPAMVRVRG